MKGEWVRSDFEEDGEVLYFFHPNGAGGGQAYVVMYPDGSVEFKSDRKVTIKSNGKVVIEKAADLIV